MDYAENVVNPILVTPNIFNKWTSGNKEIDEFIQNFQLYAKGIRMDKNLKILSILQKVVLTLCIKQNELMDLFIIGI
jgi:hypothetical protein